MFSLTLIVLSHFWEGFVLFVLKTVTILFVWFTIEENPCTVLSGWYVLFLQHIFHLIFLSFFFFFLVQKYVHENLSLFLLLPS